MRQGKEMDTKFVIFVIISAVLVAATYSSSTYFVSAELVTTCTGTSKTKTTCFVNDTDNYEITEWKCTKNKDGKTWNCVQAMTQTGDAIPFELKKALNLATESAVNTTGTVKDFTSKKKDLSSSDNEITRQEENSSSLR
jgi:hypothetical protein